jgi:transposase
MISFPANTDIFINHAPISFACGIDGVVRYCRLVLQKEPISQAYFMFINKNRRQIRVLWYDGQGFLLCTKRSSHGQFQNWPKNHGELCTSIRCFDAQIFFADGDPKAAKYKNLWKKIA